MYFPTPTAVTTLNGSPVVETYAKSVASTGVLQGEAANAKVAPAR
jgi:hypothetical protein